MVDFFLFFFFKFILLSSKTLFYFK